jgi:hypothetical protein
MDAEQQNKLIQSILPPPEKGEAQEIASPDATLKLAIFDKSQSGLEEYQMTDAVQQAFDSGVIRNQAAKFFLPALCQLRETDLRDARAERKAAQVSIDSLRDGYHTEQTNRAVLEERLRGETRVRGLQNIFITLGGVLLGCGLAPLLAESFAITIVFTVVGIVMLIVGWFYPERKGKS